MRISDWSSDVCSSDLRLDRHIGHLFGTHRFKGEFTVGKLDLLAQRRLERLFLAIAANPDHLYPHPPGPDAARVHRAAAVLDHFDRLDERTIDISRSEEHTSELQSLMRNSYAVFCLQKKKKKI